MWKDQLEIVFYEVKQKNLDKNLAKTFQSVYFLWYWSVWETAQFCLNNRLKTPLGKPQETFLTIEGLILIENLINLAFFGIIFRFLGEIKALANEISSTDGNEWKFSTNNSLEWFRVRWFLNFVELLDKQMYNAYEGTAFSLPAAQKV